MNLKKIFDNTSSERKYWEYTYDDFVYPLTEDKLTKEEAIKEAEELVTNMVINNERDYRIDVQENTDEWTDKDYDEKELDWLKIEGTFYKGKCELRVYDFMQGKTLRDDQEKRERRNLHAKLNRRFKKEQKEFDEKYGWLQSLSEILRSNNSNKDNGDE